jgi:PAS domain S-box-containing protein
LEKPAERADKIVAELRRSERRFRDIAEATSDWIWETDRDHRFTYVSDKIQKVSGTPGAAFIGRTVAEVMRGAEGPEKARHLAELDLHKPVVDFRYWIERPFGRRFCTITGYPIFDDDGAFCGYRGIGSDITELKLAEERQKLLVAELRHRLKNTMAMVMSLMTLTLRSATDLEHFAESFRARLGAMDRAHDLLSSEAWTGVRLRDLLSGELDAYRQGDGRNIILTGPPVTVGPNAAPSLALVLHELTTNALKYGALSSPAGRLEVAWRSDGRRLTIDWVERDGPPVVPPTRAGFGSSLLEKALRHGLDGTTALRFDPEGVSCTLDLDFAAVTSERKARAATTETSSQRS